MSNMNIEIEKAIADGLVVRDERNERDYIVGHKYEFAKTGCDLTSISNSDDTVYIDFYYCNMHFLEKNMMRTDGIEFRLEHRDNVIYVYTRYKQAKDGWSIRAYTPHLSSTDLDVLEKLQVMVRVFEATTGELVSLRTCFLGEDFTKRFKQFVEEEKQKDFNYDSYLNTVKRHRYLDSDYNMVKAAKAARYKETIEKDKMYTVNAVYM